jgi:hypothetical protein
MVGSAGPRFANANVVTWGNQLVAELGVQMLQLVTSSFVLRHPIYSRATGSFPSVALRKQW